MKKKKKNRTFLEEYEIRYDYKKYDGYWVFSATETVEVELPHGINEKNNHDKAKRLFMEKHPHAIVRCVTYC